MQKSEYATRTIHPSSLMIRNRFVLLFDILLIILSVLGLRTMTNGFETDKRIARIVSVYPLCEAIRWSFPLILERSATPEA